MFPRAKANVRTTVNTMRKIRIKTNLFIVPSVGSVLNMWFTRE